MWAVTARIIDSIVGDVLLLKADPREHVQLELDFAEALKRVWDEQTVAALRQAAKLIQAGQGPLTEDEFKAILSVFEAYLGPGVVAAAGDEVLKWVAAAYELGRGELANALKIDPSWSLMDQRAVEVSQKHTVYWMRTYYTRELGEQVAFTARQLVFVRGLGRMDLADELKRRLGDEVFTQGYNYWDVLASAVIQRTRILGDVATLEEAGAKTYEILAMMDERTCPICRRMDGKRFTVQAAVDLRNRIVGAQTPEGVKAAAPWITANKESLELLDNASPEELIAHGWHLPPFHGRCRCTVVVSGFEAKAPAPQAKPKTYAEVLAEKENEIAQLRDHERAYLLDEHGNVVLGKDGEAHEVRFTPEELKLFPGRVFTHNHPSGGSFSFADVHLACYHNLREIRAVGQKYVYSMRPPDTGWSAEFWDRTVEMEATMADIEVQNEFWPLIKAGLMTKAEANFRHWHEVWTRVAKRTGLKYVRESR